MTPDFSYSFKNPFGDDKPVEPKLTGPQRIIRDTIILIIIAYICGMFYSNGKETGRHEALREIAPISNDLARMQSYLQEHGIYMFEQEEIRQLQSR
jgi:hypothetical protein